MLVNIYARTRVSIDLSTEFQDDLSIQVKAESSAGNLTNLKAYGRLFSPKEDIAKLFAGRFDSDITRGCSLEDSKGLEFDSAKIMAKLEAKDPDRFRLDDRVVAFKSGCEGVVESQVEAAKVSGLYHLGVLVEGEYHPEGDSSSCCCQGGDHKAMGGKPEHFERVLTYTFASESKVG